MEFNKAYNRQEFVHFLQHRFLPEDFVPTVEPVAFYSKMTYSTQVVRLGSSAELDLVVYEVRHNSTNDARVSLSKEAFRMLADETVDRALVIFVPEDNNANYRFSLIEITVEGKDDSSRVTRNYSNPHRYSYFLGKGIAYYTPNKYLNEKGRVVNADDLRSRFSVEVLTKEFYNELSDWYAWAIKIIRFPNDLNDKTDDDKYNNESAIRLITRLIFVWFLKQRHLIPDEFFDERYIADNLIDGFNPHAMVDLFSKSNESKYYKAILQNLFFAMLNSPITPEGSNELSERHFRKGRSDYDNNKLMRYESYFKNPQLFVDLANKIVPFLNGGLFDCLDEKDKDLYYDSFTDRKDVSKYLIVPDYLFFGEEVGKNIDLSEWYGDKKKKKVSARGIIDILKRYNFTVEENTPFDQEVSLDPELLGKVFENLLASYNPETQTTARKQTGSFYTPREIVQYMVNESLVAHLKRTVGEELEPQFRRLLQYSDYPVELSDTQRKSIMQSLYNCKILDPACGSGAFPMGILQQMVHILNRIDEGNDMWREMMLSKAIDETSEAYRTASSDEREEMKADIYRSFDENINRPDYARKLYLIENCIYGVDIQPIAIQISKLRFFISLVVDQKTNNNPADNFGIRPLPNLEAKFVAANTLIGLDKKNASLFDSDAIKAKEKELKTAKHKIFGAKTVKTKRKYRQIVNDLRLEIANMLKDCGAVGNIEAQQLASWDMFNQNTSSPFFDPEWMFGVKNGFDIVIANPPYGANISKMKKYVEKNYLHQNYQYDSYMLFIERGIGLTSNSIITYIIPNTWLTNITSKNIRKFIFENTTINKIVHFKDYVFGAIVDTEIVCIKTSVPNNNDVRIIINSKNHGFEERKCCKQENYISTEGAPISLFIEDKFLPIIDKISNCAELSQFCKITQGTKPFQVGKGKPKQTKDIVKEKPYVSTSYTDGFRPLLRGSLMDRYEIRWENNYYIKYGIWLAEPRESANYDADEKIVIRQTGDSIIATIDNKQFVVRDNLYTCLPLKSTVDLYTILGILNSELINWFYKKVINPEEGEALAQVKKAHLNKIPIASINNIKLSQFVKKVIADKSEHKNCCMLLKEIDAIVYHLYGLTYNEVLIVAPNTQITREEYERTN
jgi:hypothetical protein B2_16718